ncbi:DMT family transporter [Microbacterium sp. ASV49]|uniref:EamA family transporter n=1 Tax=Microbacterium candidum TaxID=3041922 RepID=A0ABT7N2W7_9MICO|nr:EamA family transporter [Microbacterium sp. ASV49]MDL9981011.1 EamA family transporter [Microbacterium sp. ASV49]
MTHTVSARAWWLYGAMALLWGIPYLFISVTVETISPAAMVAGRTLLGAVILLPFAIKRGALKPAMKRWPWVLLFGAIEMAGPFLLLGHAEKTIPSGLTGLLVATVPLFGAIIAFFGGDRGMLRPLRLGGLVVGFAGVAIIVVGPGLSADGPGALLAIGEVLLVAVCYATAPFVVAHKLQGVPALGSVTISLAAVGLFYLPIGIATQHQTPSVPSALSLLALAIFCTALAFIAFFALIEQVGPARAPLFTYVNPVVAIVLGSLILGEPLTPALLIGFPIVLIGCWFAATGGVLRTKPASEVPPVPDVTELPRS